MLEQLAVNLNGAVQKKTLDGKDYFVVPLSMIVPGVLHGSKGPLLYPIEEIARNADAWNDMPIVVNHPTNDKGDAVSARSPDVLDRFCVGRVFNAQVNGKLSAEGWFDIQKTRKLCPSTYDKLVKNQPEELSTGLFTDNEPVKNGRTDDGREYVGIARNYRPDHLAILPDKKGACSIKDGCGVNINEASEQDLEPYKLDWDGDPVGNDEGCASCGPSCECEACKEEYAEKSDEEVPVVENEWVRLIPNAQLDPNLTINPFVSEKQRRYLWKNEPEVAKAWAHGKHTGKGKTHRMPKATGEDVAGPLAAKERKSQSKKRKKSQSREAVVANSLTWNERDSLTCNQACAIVKDGVLNGQPLSEEQRKFFAAKCGERVTKNQNQQIVNNKETGMPLTKEKKEELIDNLIANEGVEDTGPWEEADRPALNALPDSKLEALERQRLLAVNAKMMDDEEEEPMMDDEEDEGEPPAKKKGKGKIPPQFLKNQSPRRKSTDEWLSDAPDEIRSAVTNALAFERRQKDQLIAAIVKNERNAFSKAYLQAQGLDVLQGLAALATNKDESNQSPAGVLIPHYSGVAGITQNLGEGFANEDLDMIPDPLDWSSKK